MKTKLFKLLCAMMAGAMLFTACGGGAGSTAANTEAPADTTQTDAEPAGDSDEDGAEAAEVPATSDGSFTIGFNNFRKGAYSLDILEKNFLIACEAMGVDTMVVNDEVKVENSATNVDNMITAGVDAIVFFGVSDTLFPVVAQKCEDAGIPFAFYDHMPTDDILEQMQGFAHYVGIAATVDTNAGYEAGEYAAAAGATKAIIVAGETTDTTHTARTNGFIEVFTAAGGEILAEGYGSPVIADAMTRANDLLTAYPDVDFIYATNGDVGTACMEALDKHPGVSAELYVTDLDPDVLTGLENGSIAAANGAHWVNVYFAAALMVNHLNGNTILDANGNAPTLEVPVMTLPSKYVDLYDRCWINSAPFTAAELQAFVGADVTLADLQAALDDYNIDNRLAALVEQGVITQDDVDNA